MSVINKMLRDLDRRQTDQATTQAVTQPFTQASGQQPLHPGVQSLDAGTRQGNGFAHGGTARWWGVAMLLLLSVGAYGLWWGSRPSRQAAPADSAGVAVTRVAPALTPHLTPGLAATTASASAPVFAAAPAVLATPSQAASAVSAVSAAQGEPVIRPLPTPKPAHVITKDQSSRVVVAGETAVQRQAAPVSAVPQPQPQATASAALAVKLPTPSAALPAASVKTESQVAMQALAHAQVQWADGEQAGALQVVHGVIARLEKSPASDTLVLAAAAREYVRMASAQQRPADALAMLVRLEAPLAKVADIWALRGNTAQRLGLHAQAVHAYLNALELQPGQARWLLAAAVSMAAQGQTVPAADLAERARRAGFMPPDVANYLQQLGVALHKP